jgi:uncharacterized membrane protein YhaH (DUF805 family)
MTKNAFTLFSIIPFFLSIFLMNCSEWKISETIPQLILIFIFFFILLDLILMVPLTLERLSNLDTARNYASSIFVNFVLVTLSMIILSYTLDDYRPLIFTLFQVCISGSLLFLAVNDRNNYGRR